MRLLALETSDQSADVALTQGEQTVAQARLEPGTRSAQGLAPLVQRLLTQAGWQPRQVELVAVSLGPGSFTGLRVGVTFAKTFAYTVGAPILGIETLEVVARQTPPVGDATLWTLVNAYRQQLFAGRFAMLDGRMEAVEPTQVVEIDAWLATVGAHDWVSGPGVALVERQLPATVSLVPAERRTPRAETVAQLAWERFQRGRRDDVFQLKPLYLRASAAEEKKARS